MRIKLRITVLAALLSTCAGVAAQEQPGQVRLTGSSGSAGVSFWGDDIRIGVGIDDDGDVHGEYFHVFGEDEDDATWIAELWASDERGGAKLNYHWLSGADSLESAVGAEDVMIGKAFLAVDQNEFDDRKLTVGMGFEGPSLFWGAYVMGNLSGSRLVDQQVLSQTSVMRFIEGSQEFEQTTVTDTITRFFEHPYDYGIGARVGHFYEDSLIRIRGGLDYESGKGNAEQFTLSMGLEKYFANTGHSLALTAERIDKSGDFEIIDNDTRALLLYRYSFGERYRPRRDVRETRIEVPESEWPMTTEVRPVKNRIEIESEAYFDFDKSNIRSDAREVLAKLVEQIRSREIVGDIDVVGHTCNIGTDEYNQGLSERRAASTVEFFVEHGIQRDRLDASGRGESQPRYSNAQEETRRLNRRVEIEFVSLEKDTEEVQVRDESGRYKWVSEPIKDPAWMQRALRNPVQHKRSVDTYRFAETETRETVNPPVVINNFPQANDDSAMTTQDVPVTIAVLANDEDADGDALTLVAVTAPANGTATVNADGSVTYTPAAGFVGDDSFSYTAADPSGAETTADVTVTVNPLPVVAADDSATTNRNQSVQIDVLANDEGSGLTVDSVGNAANGTVSVEGGGVLYTPNRDFTGSDTFTYRARDDRGTTSEATVTVTVMPFNRDPVANDDSASTPKNVPITIDVLANDSDPDGDALTIVSVNPEVTPYGRVVITADNRILYDPNPGWFGGDEFEYTVADGFGGQATARVVLDVTE